MVLSLLTVFGYMCVCMWLIFSDCEEFFSLQVVGALTSVILFVSVFLSTFACVSVCERKFKTKKYIESDLAFEWWCVGVFLCVNVCFVCVYMCERRRGNIFSNHTPPIRHSETVTFTSHSVTVSLQRLRTGRNFRERKKNPSMNLSPRSMVIKTELCNFSGYRIYPGHGRRFIRGDGRVSYFTF